MATKSEGIIMVDNGPDDNPTGDSQQGETDDGQADKNILILGITGAGKASIANVILDSESDSCMFNVGSTIESTTRESGTSTRRCNGYNIVIIDTCSLTGKKKNIKREIRDVLYSLTSLNVIIIAFKNERFTPQEQKSFKKIKKAFKVIPDASSITTLVVTYCEQKDEKAREEIKKELGEQGAPTRDIVHFAESKVLLVGLPVIKDVAPTLQECIKQRRDNDEQELKKIASKPLKISVPNVRPKKSSRRSRFCIIS